MSKNFKKTQQDMTELNSDGNDSRGRNGEDLRSEEDEDLPEHEKIRKEQAQHPSNG